MKYSTGDTVRTRNGRRYTVVETTTFHTLNAYRCASNTNGAVKLHLERDLLPVAK